MSYFASPSLSCPLYRKYQESHPDLGQWSQTFPHVRSILYQCCHLWLVEPSKLARVTEKLNTPFYLGMAAHTFNTRSLWLEAGGSL